MTRMNYFAAAALALCLGAAIPGKSQEPRRDTPKAVVSETVYNAGSVLKGEIVKHDFFVENRGTRPLSILSVKPGCGCTAPEFDKTVPPGGKGRITLSVNTQAFKGPINKSTAVTTDDPDMKTFQLVVKADVKEIIAITPAENQSFGLVAQGQSLSRDYKFKATDDKPFKITNIQCSDPSVKHELKMASDGKSGVLTVTIPPNHSLGAVNARLTLSTDHPKAPVIQLNAYATVREPLAIDPSAISFGKVSASELAKRPDDQGWTRMISVFDDRGGLEIKSVSSSSPVLTATVVPDDPGKRYFVKVRVMPTAKTGDFKGTVTIVTSKKTFEVAVDGKVTPG